jgi:hypothetical protein
VLRQLRNGGSGARLRVVNNRRMDTTDHEARQRVRGFTLLIAQLAAQYDMSVGELAAAAGGACAVSRLLQQANAHEQGLPADDTSPEMLVMLFDARMRLPVVVEDPPSGFGDSLMIEAPEVSYQ